MGMAGLGRAVVVGTDALLTLEAGCLAPARLCNGRLKPNISRVLPKQKPLKWKGWRQTRSRGVWGHGTHL